MTPITWLSERVLDGHLAVRVGRVGNDVVAEWPGLARLVVDRTGDHPRFEPDPVAPPESIEKLRSGAARALVGYLRGEVSLHASAVACDEGAIAFLGDADAGKSTLAYALVARGSWSFLSDDLLRVDGIEALPSETASWLRGPARELFRADQPPLITPRPARKSVRLRGIVELIWGDAPIRFRALKGVAAASVLLRSMVRFPLDEPALHVADLERVATFSRDIPVLELVRPHGLEHLVAVEAALDQIRQGGFVWT